MPVLESVVQRGRDEQRQALGVNRLCIITIYNVERVPSAGDPFSCHAVNNVHIIKPEVVEGFLKLIKNWLLMQERFRGGHLEDEVIRCCLSTARCGTESELAHGSVQGSLQEDLEPHNVDVRMKIVEMGSE